mmetsp:Transcript_25103/g.45231  ORF Transcript_25103/g.45231 Transcript_25103/m.45231 type:complete len:225 (-) Transcript_25103:53-727(-)
MRHDGVPRREEIDLPHAELGTLGGVLGLHDVLDEVQELEGLVVGPAVIVPVLVDGISITLSLQIVPPIAPPLQESTPYLLHPFLRVLQNRRRNLPRTFISRLMVKHSSLQWNGSQFVILQCKVEIPLLHQRFLHVVPCIIEPFASQFVRYVGDVANSIRIVDAGFVFVFVEVVVVVDVDRFGTSSDVVLRLKYEDGFDSFGKEGFGGSYACPACSDYHSIVLHD